ncbi:MAG: PD-(D/E)XK nuclease family protein, partial [Firmicutes bacterium]|nr:PD-(D/E)XK nuclease family protein [Bacillota bacterium]
AEKGTVMHCVMEHLDFKKDYDLNQLETFMGKMVSDGILTQEEADSVNRNKVLNFFASDLGKRAKKSKMLFKEESIAMEFPPSELYMGDKYGDTKEGIIVHGIIDCYFYEGDEIVLYDYKTDYVEKGIEAEIADKYKVQLSVYKRAIEAATGKVVKDAYIYFFFIDKELKLSLK